MEQVLELNDLMLAEDIKSIVDTTDLSWLDGKRVLITGATGLIGSQVARTLAYYSRINKGGPELILVVRSMRRAEEKIPELVACKEIHFLCSDITEIAIQHPEADYMIHCASITGSSQFVNTPVETSWTTLMGTKQLLEAAKTCGCQGIVYLSSMEVYGYPEKGQKVYEDQIGNLTPLKVRNSYPLSKMMAESLCCSYAAEYDVPVKIARLTQTFGPGVEYGDGRVFAEFARCVIENRPIILKTKGETERSYLYTADAVKGILAVLKDGAAGAVYNLANEETYCSITEMADIVAKLNNVVTVEYHLEDTEALGYANTLYMDLDTSAARSLGWSPKVQLSEMYARMIESMKRGIDR